MNFNNVSVMLSPWAAVADLKLLCNSIGTFRFILTRGRGEGPSRTHRPPGALRTRLSVAHRSEPVQRLWSTHWLAGSRFDSCGLLLQISVSLALALRPSQLPDGGVSGACPKMGIGSFATPGCPPSSGSTLCIQRAGEATFP